MPGKHNAHNFNFFVEKNEKNEKYLELPDLARKLIRKSFQTNLPLPPIIFFCKQKVLRIA
jgi:hypothetical protein